MAALCGCGSKAPVQSGEMHPVIYIIDSGQTGWVKIYYNRPSEKELPVESGSMIAHVGQDLKLFTRSRMHPSWEQSRFYYQTPDGKLVQLSAEDNASRRIWGEEKNAGQDREWETFFVGEQEQFSKQFQSKPVEGLMAPSPEMPQPDTPPADPGKVLTELPSQ
jgi:hypothetical protein